MTSQWSSAPLSRHSEVTLPFHTHEPTTNHQDSTSSFKGHVDAGRSPGKTDSERKAVAITSQRSAVLTDPSQFALDSPVSPYTRARSPYQEASQNSEQPHAGPSLYSPQPHRNNSGAALRSYNAAADKERGAWGSEDESGEEWDNLQSQYHHNEQSGDDDPNLSRTAGMDESANGGLERPPMHRPTDGRSGLPLLKDERGRPSYDSPNGSARPPMSSRRSTFRSRSPDFDAKTATRRKYTYAAFFLALSLVLYPWLLVPPLASPACDSSNTEAKTQMVESQELHLTTRDTHKSPVPYILKTTAFVTTALTVAGGSWYLAVDLTTASDLTAIYNCSAFFAYAFSIPLLKDKLRFDKIMAVGIAIAGVLIVAYGDSGSPAGEGKESEEAKSRTWGNIIIGIGSVLYGLYEVLYKKLACPPEGVSPGRGMIFAMTFGSLIGCFTLFVLWIPLPILHYTGLETFEFPRGEAAWMMLISVLANATFSGSFLVLISLTSPVLSSVAALLTIFLVAIVDWALPNGQAISAAALVGGLLIIGAFVLLSWSTYREMNEERRKRLEAEIDESDAED
ncbi:hypothetical protein MMC25_007174 [Agyrium rufum]|nr:hypothetical protein [Agyrium rufum]